MKKYQFFSLLTASLFAFSCGSKKETTAKDNTLPVMVTTATADGAVNGGINVSGQVSAVQTASISTRLMGTITKITVKPGDAVRKGQLLATISSNDIQAKREQTNAAIAEAEANVKNAQKDFERFTNLYNKQSASAKELDNVTLQYTAAKARLQAATQTRSEVNALMSYSSLTAPFDGTVTQRMADEGNMASPGMPLLIIEQNTQLQIAATVSEEVVGHIKKGDKAAVTVKSQNRTFDATVSEISSSSQLTGGQYLVKFNIPETQKKELFSGMYVNVFMPITTASIATGTRVMIPLSSVIQTDQLTGIYTISSSNTALLRWIRTGKTAGDKVEVLSGLSASEKFIVSASGKLYNGAPVKEK